MRRRDGVALAVTGTVPDRVRARVLAEHHAHLADLARDQVIRRVHLGRYPLPIPFGYRRDGLDDHHRPDGSVTPWWEPAAAHRTEAAVRAVRAGRALARSWVPDPDAANTVRLMGSWARDGVPAGEIASRLAADFVHPRLMTTSGRPRPWTAHAVRAVLGDPALTGHSVWGRTRHGRPVPPEMWVVSRTRTHTAILTTPLWQVTRASLAAHPDDPYAAPATTASPGWTASPWWTA